MAAWQARRAHLALIASIIAGVSYWAVMRTMPQTPVLVTWKASGVALLALWAWLCDGAVARQIAGVMALGALADAVIEVNFVAGGALFFLAHLLAIRLYWREKRGNLRPADRPIGGAILVLTPLAAWALSGRPEIGLYALGLAAMAASAWLSRFPRALTGLGALLIFARMGPLAGSGVPGLLVMPLYYAGQLLICTGVVRAGDQASAESSA